MEGEPVGWYTGNVTFAYKHGLQWEADYETMVAPHKLPSWLESSTQMDYVLRFQSPLTTAPFLIWTGKPFMQVHATDRDDPTTPHAQLRYSILHHFPNPYGEMLFEIDSVTGEISPSKTGM